MKFKVTHPIISGLLSVCAAVSLSVRLDAQTHNWDIQAREKSQNANSRALNFLQKESKTKGAIDQAINILVEGTNADPTDPVPLATLGLALDLKERYKEALEVLAKSYRMDQKSVETNLSIGVTYYMAHNFEHSVEALNRLIHVNPKFCPGHVNLGFAFIRVGDLAKAKQQFKQAIVCNPSAQPAYQGLALVDYMEGDLESASEEAQHSESLTSYPPVTLLLAEISFLRGDQDRLVACLQRLNKIKYPIEQRSMAIIGYPKQHDFHWDPYLLDEYDRPNFVNARALDLPKQEKKRQSIAARGRINEAIASAQKALEDSPDDYYIFRQLGLLNMAKGDYNDAVQNFNKVVSIAPGSHIDFLYLGRALSLAGKAPEAAQCVFQYQKHFPDQKLSSVFSSIMQAAPPAPPAQQMPPNKPPDTPTDAGF